MAVVAGFLLLFSLLYVVALGVLTIAMALGLAVTLGPVLILAAVVALYGVAAFILGHLLSGRG